MNAKTIAIVSYITIIGWIIAYLQYKNSEQKSELAAYHLGQGLGVFIFALILNVAVFIVAAVIPALGGLLSLLGLLPLILIIFGIITASNEAFKPVPLIGKLFEGKFNF